MKERILRTELGAFEPQPWDGLNRSSYRPVNDKVLILPDVASEMAGEHGLIVLPGDIQRTQSAASETGTIVAVGRRAFWDYPEEEKLKPGDHVIYERYAGRPYMGADGLVYRIMSDVSIVATEEEIPDAVALETAA